MSEFGAAPGAGDARDAYVVGAAAVTWEDEVYVYGGLTPDG